MKSLLSKQTHRDINTHSYSHGGVTRWQSICMKVSSSILFCGVGGLKPDERKKPNVFLLLKAFWSQWQAQGPRLSPTSQFKRKKPYDKILFYLWIARKCSNGENKGGGGRKERKVEKKREGKNRNEAFVNAKVRRWREWEKEWSCIL